MDYYLYQVKKRRDNFSVFAYRKRYLNRYQWNYSYSKYRNTRKKKKNLENVCKNINISDKIIDVSEKK